MPLAGIQQPAERTCSALRWVIVTSRVATAEPECTVRPGCYLTIVTEFYPAIRSRWPRSTGS